MSQNVIKNIKILQIILLLHTMSV